jgi:hypothetical protein
MDIQSIIALNLNAWMENHPRLNSALQSLGPLASAKTVIIELPIYQDGNLSWTFADEFSLTRFNDGQ